MKTLLKIKRIRVFENNGLTVVFVLHNGQEVIKSGDNYINAQTGEVYEPLSDEFVDCEIVGFIAD